VSSYIFTLRNRIWLISEGRSPGEMEDSGRTSTNYVDEDSNCAALPFIGPLQYKGTPEAPWNLSLRTAHPISQQWVQRGAGLRCAVPSSGGIHILKRSIASNAVLYACKGHLMFPTRAHTVCRGVRQRRGRYFSSTYTRSHGAFP
jgi:hypothetical protein